MARTRATTITVATLALSILLGGCSNEGKPSSVPSSDPPSSSTRSMSTSAPKVPAYLVKYSPAQRTAFWQALATYRSYLTATAPLFKSGKATPEALQVLKRLEVLWESDWAALQREARYSIHLTGDESIVSASPTRIVLSSTEGNSVTLHACVDSRQVTAFQHGNVLPKKGPDPVINLVEVDQVPNGVWKVTQQKATTEPC
jgi:hypothetical protein